MTPPTPSRRAAAPQVETDEPIRPDEVVRHLRTADGRLNLTGCIIAELLAGVSYSREKELGTALRGIRLAAEAEDKREELDHLRELAAQLESDRRERAAMESGVQFTDQAPQLPDQGSGVSN